ncbi:MAG: peptidase [Nonomuraea sp.]|nr:peptidase [Nonomuraea sp.]
MPPPPPPPPPNRGQWQQPPRRKKGMGVAGILGLVFGAMAAIFVLIVVVSAASSSGRHRTYVPEAMPSISHYQPPTRLRTRTTQDQEPTRATERPTQQPTTEEPSPDTTQSEEPRVTLNTSLTGNTFYKVGGLPRSDCRAGNANIFSHSQLKALILKTGQCMNRVWGPALQRQGIEFRAPGYMIASGRGRGACGDYPSRGSMVPYYCPRNNTIYASTTAMARGNGNARGYGEIIQWNGGIISMMAHEYGHHIQQLTGVMDSWWAKTTATSSNSARLGLSRRLELQATCIGGMWMRSVASSYPVSTSNRIRLFTFYGQVGDYPGWPRDHGAPVNNNRWFRQGWEKNQAYQCNTWAAPSSTTS